MAGPWLDLDDVICRLQEQINAAGGQKVWAVKHGLSVGYVCDVLHGRTPPGEKISTAMGLEKVLRWRAQTQRGSQCQAP